MKLGIVGNGSIVEVVLASLSSTDIKVTALWSHSEDKGKVLCDKYGLNLYTDYEAFLKDDSFDTVYIGLVNSMHFQYAMDAVEAHKNVIVEKPFTSRYGEACALIEEAEMNGVMLFEAILSRYGDEYTKLIPHLDDIGDLKFIRANYSQYSRRYDAYMQGKVLPAFDPKFSGGALYDINVYNIHFIAGLFGGPRSAVYYANKGFNKIDTSGVLIMGYDGFTAVCTGAKDSTSKNGIVLQGTEGYIELDGRPGMSHEIKLYRNGADGPEILGHPSEEDPYANEFMKIAQVIDEQDETSAAAWMIHTKQVMSILDQARVSAGIHFDADDDASFTVTYEEV